MLLPLSQKRLFKTFFFQRHLLKRFTPGVVLITKHYYKLCVYFFANARNKTYHNLQFLMLKIKKNPEYFRIHYVI